MLRGAGDAPGLALSPYILALDATIIRCAGARLVLRVLRRHLGAFVRRHGPTQLSMPAANHGRHTQYCFELVVVLACVPASMPAIARVGLRTQKRNPMLPDLRFVIGAALALALLVVTGFGVAATWRLARPTKM